MDIHSVLMGLWVI